MTKEDIIKLAREAGFLIDYYAQQYQPNCILSTHGLIDENLQRFANLVAAHKDEPPPEWEGIKNILDEYGLQAISFVAEWKAAQRLWVGLTPEEILDLFDVNNVYGSKWIEFARTVENKLKEKNT